MNLADDKRADDARHDEENAWIAATLEGDVAAFRKLYDRYFDYVTRQVGRMMGLQSEREDVVQDVFVAVYRSLGTYRGDSAFSTWLYRLTYNITVTHLRRRPRTVELAAWRPLRDSQSAWNQLEARDMIRVLYAALDSVPLEQREAFLLHEVEGMKLREVAELTGASINTVAARVRRTREKMQEVLEQASSEETSHD